MSASRISLTREALSALLCFSRRADISLLIARILSWVHETPNVTAPLYRARSPFGNTVRTLSARVHQRFRGFLGTPKLVKRTGLVSCQTGAWFIHQFFVVNRPELHQFYLCRVARHDSVFVQQKELISHAMLRTELRVVLRFASRRYTEDERMYS